MTTATRLLGLFGTVDDRLGVSRPLRQPGPVLVAGRESAGIPQEVAKRRSTMWLRAAWMNAALPPESNAESVASRRGRPSQPPVRSTTQPISVPAVPPSAPLRARRAVSRSRSASASANLAPSRSGISGMNNHHPQRQARGIDQALAVALVVSERRSLSAAETHSPVPSASHRRMYHETGGPWRRRPTDIRHWPPHATIGQTIAERRMADLEEPDVWHRLSCSSGAQDERLYDWADLPLRPVRVEEWTHALLVRRHPIRPADLADYLVDTRDATPLAAMVRAAGSRWAVEDTLKLANGQVTGSL